MNCPIRSCNHIFWLLHRRLILRLLVALTLTAELMAASQHWICVTTPHFEMYTTNSAKRATQALEVFEQVRYFFLQNSKNKHAPEDRVRIIAFSSEKDYKPYRLNAGAFAYYVQSHQRDYIVMQDIEADHHQTAVHEYTHLIVQHAKMELPIWLNEGLAELYSSLEPHGRQAMIGRPLAGRVGTLLQQRWMDWGLLFAVDSNSPFYNESEKMSIFYAQSWLLTHMLALSPAYRPKFSSFLSTVANGTPAAEALQKVYGKTVSEVGLEAAAYIRQASLSAALFDITLSRSDLDARVSDLSDLQTGLALADLLASGRETMAEARIRLLALAQANPQNSDVEESLGYLAWGTNNLSEACMHFSLAVEQGSKNSHMIYELAGLEQNAGAPPETVAGLLSKVLALQPDQNDARIFLAEVEAERGHYGAALAAIAPVRKVEPEQAFRLFSVTAFSHANLHDIEGAKSLAKTALAYAKTPPERAQIEQLLHSLEAANTGSMVIASSSATTTTESADQSTASSRPVPQMLIKDRGLPRVSGKTKAFECGQNSFRLHLQVGVREMVFGMNKPQDIVVRNIKDLQWSCGPLQAREITVVYQPSGTANLDGTVSELIF